VLKENIWGHRLTKEEISEELDMWRLLLNEVGHECMIPLETIRAMQKIEKLQVLQNVKDLYCKIEKKKLKSNV
jgi:hypothetical protein